MPGPVKIFCTQTQSLVDAVVDDEIEADVLNEYEQVWKPSLLALQTEDSHWEWTGKLASAIPPDSYEHYCLECGGQAQGLMQLIVKGYQSRLARKPIIYLDYIAVAPWNRPGSGNPKYKLIGSVLLAETIESSIRHGCKGRVGLHSLPGAIPFYTRAGMTRVGCDNAYYGLEYFEFTEKSAILFLKSAGGSR